MRISSFIILAIGVLLLANGAWDEFTGATHTPPHFGKYHRSNSDAMTPVFKAVAPAQFRNAMTVNWAVAMAVSIVGMIWLTYDWQMERDDPMATDSDEEIDAQLKQDEEDEKVRMAKERPDLTK